MSEPGLTQPEAGAEHRFRAWLWGITFCVALLVAYPLSEAPLGLAIGKGWLPESWGKVHWRVYEPLNRWYETAPVPVQVFFSRYKSWWYGEILLGYGPSSLRPPMHHPAMPGEPGYGAGSRLTITPLPWIEPPEQSHHD